MQCLNDKIRVLRKNREWTQAKLADKLSVSEAAVHKWETGKNTPDIETVRSLAKVFLVPTNELIDNNVEFYEYEELYKSKVPNQYEGDSVHAVYDAGLNGFAKLHRFTNSAGEKYSAIYRGSYEMYSCPRDQEADMLNCWNAK